MLRIPHNHSTDYQQQKRRDEFDHDGFLKLIDTGIYNLKAKKGR